MLNLIFFFVAGSCSVRDQETVTIQWENKKATGISIPLDLLKMVPDDSIPDLITVHLSDTTNRPAIIGESLIRGKDVLFQPLLPFTRGLWYEVRVKNTFLARFQVPQSLTPEAPRLLSVFPSSDTVPENLLKIYLQFSKPMREGQALKHIVMLKNNHDTIEVFLDLQPELWDRDRKMLTLWLDPGRIKRDLQPNQKLGKPLEEGMSYRLLVDTLWQDAEGDRLDEKWSRDFFVSGRDSESPSLKKWIVSEPGTGTREPLQIEFKEPLDYVLAGETIFITDADNNMIKGQIRLDKKESVLKFTPEEPWEQGTYQLQSEARLEDLAGNNLDRLFDREVSATDQQQTEKKHIRMFTIK